MRRGSALRLDYAISSVSGLGALPSTSVNPYSCARLAATKISPDLRLARQNGDGAADRLRRFGIRLIKGLRKPHYIFSSQESGIEPHD
jgi:hypothetical protein